MHDAPDDLIVAPATAGGRAAIAMVRLSGTGAADLVSGLASRTQWVPRRATRARLALPDGVTEDALVTMFAGPHSYTGQDLVEITTHGSPALVDILVRACVDRGARLARGGEFTLRAYLNGRIDLVQAEAVADMVTATTSAQLRVASSHLDGALSARIREIGDGIAEVRALLEASLDFPDEGFHFITPADVVARLGALHGACERLLGSAEAGRRLHDGARVVVAGRPNAGKSSLFNALLRRSRAIVTAVPGTTRDLLTETTEIGGVPVTLVDTAGLRESADEIEREGVERARDSIEAADMVLLVVDPAAPEADVEESRRLLVSVGPDRVVCVFSKADLSNQPRGLPAWAPEDAVRVSSVTGDGIEALELRLAGVLGQAAWEGETLTRARHRSLVTRCAASLEAASAAAASGASEEFVLVDLHDALTALADLRGVETTDAVLGTIFASFCVGK